MATQDQIENLLIFGFDIGPSTARRMAEQIAALGASTDQDGGSGCRVCEEDRALEQCTRSDHDCKFFR